MDQEGGERLPARHGFVPPPQGDILRSGLFSCQQSAEKYLKARLEEANVVSPRTHDLTRLLNLLLPEEPMWAALRPSLAALSQYAVEFRYPGHEATAHDMTKAIKDARAMRREARLALGLMS